MLEFRTAGFANDIIVVKQRNGTLCCSAVNVRFPKQDVTTTFWNEKNVTVSINGTVRNFSLCELNPRNESNDGEFRFSSRCLKCMRLRPDLNDITFKLRGQDSEVKARMFLWRWDSLIVITDVDTTITKSDVRGIVFHYFGVDWTRNGVCHLFSAIKNNGYKVIYLTGRPRYMAEATRNMLDDMVQGDEVLPKGPVIVSPDGLTTAFNREVLRRTQYTDFKIRKLKQIRKLFPNDHQIRKEVGPFHAGFGNRPNDGRVYAELKIPCNRIFHLNSSKGGVEVKCDKETVGFFPDDYTGLISFVDDLFPPVQDCATPHHSQTFARRVKEYFKSLFRPYHCCGSGARTDS